MIIFVLGDSSNSWLYKTNFLMTEKEQLSFTESICPMALCIRDALNALNSHSMVDLYNPANRLFSMCFLKIAGEWND